MMSLWDALRMNMMISYQELVRTFPKIKDPKIRFQAQKQRRQKARQQADDARFNAKPRDTKEMKAQRAAEKQKARDEKANLKAKQQLQKRQEVAELKLRHAGLQVSGIKGKYGLDPKSQYEALRYIHQQSEEFAKGNISSQRMNALIRERVTLLRREAAQQAKVTQAQRTQYAAVATKLKAQKGGNAPIVGGGVLGSLALTAGSFGVGQRIIDKGNENLDLVRQSALVKTNPNAIKTMVTWGQQHGVDSANTSKAVDNMKDVRERLAMTVNDAQMKNGEWKGGDGGITSIMNKFGWGIEDVKTFQNRPLDFIQATVNEGQRRGMSQAQIGTLIESLGDDLMHYTDMFMNNGAEYNKTLKTLVESGQTLNDEQIRQVSVYGDLSVAMGNLMNGIDNQLFTGWMKGFADGGDDLVRNTKVITESAGLLGEGLGDLAKQVTGFVGEISSVVSDLNAGIREKFPDWFSEANKPAAQAVIDGVTGSADSAASWVQDKTGFNTRSVGHAVKGWLGIDDQPTGTAVEQYGLNGDSLQGGALRDSAISSLTSTNSAPSYNLAPVFNLNLEASVPLTIASDSSRLSDYIDFQARASQASFAQSLTLSALSGQSSTGG
ncbi:cell envelope integrity protein TolA [Enterobacter hormaechei]|uniref:cell envelope integrity protein TolA n=1 Tax=Enterobacter hormaechei TaxID=158836 RepID=UPI00192DF3A0|nr:cell envelope integrity protein TolA [Enterobacter hormaechei]MBL5987533.1 cell envelope integrity protein TolA [Enterobacter hormaechei]MBL5993614.1 cell envelope integrity protein TolA [Enterobacter hormaechei]MBL6044778.1 cell envelope integrity protein TolA [Enterobacter hormaechei]MBL6049466.1 cell envelope integrity protein TolA [Enterobacter hormaechei]MBL6069178.1 cell envelope integrity protein TolA [Enterobacter hormaechei]